MSNLDQGGLFFERCGGGCAASSLSRIVALLPCVLRGRLRLPLASLIRRPPSLCVAEAASPPPRFWVSRCGFGFASSSLLRFVAFGFALRVRLRRLLAASFRSVWVCAAGAASPPPRFLDSSTSFLVGCGGGFATSVRSRFLPSACCRIQEFRLMCRWFFMRHFLEG